MLRWLSLTVGGRVWASWGAEVHAMNINDHWSVSLSIIEIDSETH
jgi:hypothetical protein